MKIILINLLSFLVIFELGFTGLGFCGHSHDHGSYHEECSENEISLCEHNQDNVPHSHSENCDHESDGCDRKECYCSCLGGFVAEIHFIYYKIYLPLTQLPNDTIDLYNFEFKPQVYRPPISVA